MTVKELKKVLNFLDEEKEIDIAIDGECFVSLSKEDIQKIHRSNGFCGYIINPENYKYRGLKSLNL